MFTPGFQRGFWLTEITVWELNAADTLFGFRASPSLLFLSCCFVVSRETTNTNFVIFGLTRPGLDPTICRTQFEHANIYPFGISGFRVAQSFV
jgi:hypothetical protein